MLLRDGRVSNCAAADSVAVLLQELRLKVLALRAYNLETMLIGEHVKSREPIVTQIRSGPHVA